MNTAITEPISEPSPLDWKNILAPTDFSEPSEEALKTAADVAQQCGAKITLLHVIQLPAAYPIEAPPGVDEIMNSARASLEAISEEIPAALLQDKLVRLGTLGTVEEIIEAARDLPADLIVIATHGYGPLKQVVLGSIAEKVVRQAPCPVLVVHRKKILQDTHTERRLNASKEVGT